MASHPNVKIMIADAMGTDWGTVLDAEPWSMVSNLPYNISVPLILDLLGSAPAIGRYLVMVQREVGERLVAVAGEDAYGAVSVRVAYRADARIVRDVPAEVFWPKPKVGSALVRLVPHEPPVDVDRDALFRVVDEGFAERRKTFLNGLRRLGLDKAAALGVMHACGLDPAVRAERLGLVDLAGVTRELLATGWRP